MKGREKKAYLERKQLVNKYQFSSDVSTIVNHKKLPRRVKNISKKLDFKVLKTKEKEENVKNNTKPEDYQQYNEFKDRMSGKGLQED